MSTLTDSLHSITKIDLLYAAYIDATHRLGEATLDQHPNAAYIDQQREFARALLARLDELTAPRSHHTPQGENLLEKIASTLPDHPPLFRVVYDDLSDSLYVSYTDAPAGFNQETPYHDLFLALSRQNTITGFILLDAHSRQDLADIRIFLQQKNLLTPEIAQHLCR